MAEPKIAGTRPLPVQLTAGTHAWCTCGESQAQPLCDGGHRGAPFTPLKFLLDEAQEVYLCTCKRSLKPPYCDGTHKTLG